jgi:glycosyltransferase involved in cell wall biosynthesis
MTDHGEKDRPAVSIVIPVYNEEAVIGAVVTGLKERYPDYEVLVVDDGSRDGSAAAASRAGARVVGHSYNRGNGAAVKTGIRSARGDILILMDGDGQHDPDEIPHLLAPMDSHDMVVGARDFRSTGARHRSLANRAYSGLASYLADHKVEDLTSGFRAIRRDVALAFAYLLPNTFSYPSTITLAMFKAGYGVKYVPINVRERVGQSKVKILRDGFRFLAIITKIITLFSPMKVFFPLGMCFLAPGLTYTIIRVVFQGYRISNPMVFSLSIATLIFTLGLISEQIAMLRLGRIDEKNLAPRVVEYGPDRGVDHGGRL